MSKNEELLLYFHTTENSDTDKTIVMEELLKLNLPLVGKIASKYIRYLDSSQSYEDLMQDGLIGLQKAIKGYDITKGYAFSTYAKPKIEAEIRRRVKNCRSIRIPEYRYAGLGKLWSIKEKSFDSLGREATPEELAVVTKRDVNDIKETFEIFEQSTVSLNYMSDQNSEMINCIEDTKCLDPKQEYDKKEKRLEFIERLKEILNSNEFQIFMLQSEDIEITEIAKSMNLSTESVNKLIVTMKHKIVVDKKLRSLL